MNNIHIRLKNLRLEHDLSQSQVAAYLGIPQQTYSNYERDIREIPAIHVIKLSGLYHVNADFLLGIDTGRTDAFDLNASFTQDIPLKAVLLHLLRLNQHNRLELVRFLSYLMNSQRK